MTDFQSGAEKTKAVTPYQENTASEEALQAQSSTDILKSKSTSIPVQLAKVMALLRERPRHTVELRDNGIMMPAARIHHLRHVDGHIIASELVTLYDANGFCHTKCARYTLIKEAPCQPDLPEVSNG